MSKRELKREMELELARLNRLIDIKVIKGYSYTEESKRHKALLSQLKKLNFRQKKFSLSGMVAKMAYVYFL